jgi:hypothetical protein
VGQDVNVFQNTKYLFPANDTCKQIPTPANNRLFLHSQCGTLSLETQNAADWNCRGSSGNAIPAQIAASLAYSHHIHPKFTYINTCSQSFSPTSSCSPNSTYQDAFNSLQDTFGCAGQTATSICQSTGQKPAPYPLCPPHLGLHLQTPLPCPHPG